MYEITKKPSKQGLGAGALVLEGLAFGEEFCLAKNITKAIAISISCHHLGEVKLISDSDAQTI